MYGSPDSPLSCLVPDCKNFQFPQIAMKSLLALSKESFYYTFKLKTSLFFMNHIAEHILSTLAGEHDHYRTKHLLGLMKLHNMLCLLPDGVTVMKNPDLF